MTDEADPMLGQVVEDRYLIEAALGSGGMGAVYRARHVKVGREVAIKILHDHLVSDPAMVERFEREAALVAKLAHENIVRVIDVGETASKQKLMVLELARGETLAEIVGREGPLGRARVIAIVRQLLQGLAHAHAAGVVHRDLKPENVIVERDHGGTEIPKIVDFGIAVLRDERNPERRLTAHGIVLGTPEFMAPEQAKGAEVDARCDLFALGVIMYAMLAGRLPFDGTGIEVALANISKNPPPIESRTPGLAVDPLLEAFARRLMARRLASRMPSARVALRLLALVESDPVAAAKLLVPAAISAPTEPMEPPVVPIEAPAVIVAPRRRQTLPVALALATLALAGGLAIAASPTVAIAPEVSYAPVEEPSISIRYVVGEPAARADEPVLREGDARNELVGTRAAAGTRTVRRARVASSPPASAAPIPVVVVPAREEARLTASAVAQRYIAVGQLLAHARNAEALRPHYRRIQLTAALATEAGRREVVTRLDWIADQLRYPKYFSN